MMAEYEVVLVKYPDIDYPNNLWSNPPLNPFESPIV